MIKFLNQCSVHLSMISLSKLTLKLNAVDTEGENDDLVDTKSRIQSLV